MQMTIEERSQLVAGYTVTYTNK